MKYRLPETYVLNKFMSYAIEPEFKKHTGQYNAACPICKEGKSFGKKKRLWYYPSSNTFHCFNCNQTWSALNWIKKTTGMSFEEIQIELSTNDISLDVFKTELGTSSFKRKELPDLPYDSINVFDIIQQQYYQKSRDFQNALLYAKNRRLDTAINKSPNLFISLTDNIHANRLCIPFYDRNKKVVFYQTRALDRTEPRYLGKAGYDKTVFGIDRVEADIPYIFLFEGPIDSMFVKNGVGVAGISLTKTQSIQLAEFPFHKRIWVLDNPQHDDTAKNKVKDLLSKGESVFNWNIGCGYKDFNEWAVFEDLDEIPYQGIIDNLITNF
jgi:DNA primase